MIPKRLRQKNTSLPIEKIDHCLNGGVPYIKEEKEKSSLFFLFGSFALSHIHFAFNKLLQKMQIMVV